MDDTSGALLFELQEALRCNYGHQDRTALITRIARDLCNHTIPRVIASHQNVGALWEARERARQDLEKRLKDLQYDQMLDEFGDNVEALLGLREKLDMKHYEHNELGELEVRLEENIEQKKRKRFEDVEQKLDEIGNWRKQMRLNIFGDAAQAIGEDVAPVIKTPVEDAAATIETPTAEFAPIDNVPATPKFPAGVYTPTVSHDLTSIDGDDRERSSSPLARSWPTSLIHCALPTSAQRSSVEERIGFIRRRLRPKQKSSRVPTKVKAEHEDDEYVDLVGQF
ncbi:hypothetical protein PV11_00439 [Exophiala sideris]|uniref:Uncharacterized protein n=1 Tax=Exophiala sideris TaxID=1016849 RepID=A0A0D1W7I6_9EURO|nr:hypothetical protein PV11_00439 [Exophiala sideris]